jgi:uncharacterized protein (DUF2147 family)
MKEKKRITLILLLTTMTCGAFAQPAEAEKALGYWYTGDKDAKMYIYKCRDGYCGKIYWLKEPNEPDGTPKVDKNNPDEKLRDRPLQGLEIMTGFVYDGDLEWEDGEIYDPESGSTYSCLMELSEDGQSLSVRGYLGLSLFGRTETWTKTEE